MTNFRLFSLCLLPFTFRLGPFRQPAGRLNARIFLLLMAGLIMSVVLLQIARERQVEQRDLDPQLLYVRSGPLLQRLAISYDALLADAYWIRAIQHYGGTRLSGKPDKRYDLLHPLLDITTSLDPQFGVAYRFGAIFLAEGYPDGPGRPDQAIELLKKGMRAQPEKWQYVYDIGFICYWWLQNYRAAADWFDRASRVAEAPWWLRPLTATTLAQGGDRESSRLLWMQMRETADNEWLRQIADLRLKQLTVLDHLDQLAALVVRYRDVTGRLPRSWDSLRRAGLLAGVPIDPGGAPYLLNLETGAVDLSPDSPLAPLPPNLRSRK